MRRHASNSRPVSGQTCRVMVTGELHNATLLTHCGHKQARNPASQQARATLRG
jgi:hypothetical protein